MPSRIVPDSRRHARPITEAAGLGGRVKPGHDRGGGGVILFI
jgi:hypothetical protein